MVWGRLVVVQDVEDARVGRVEEGGEGERGERGPDRMARSLVIGGGKHLAGVFCIRQAPFRKYPVTPLRGSGQLVSLRSPGPAMNNVPLAD